MYVCWLFCGTATSYCCMGCCCICDICINTVTSCTGIAMDCCCTGICCTGWCTGTAGCAAYSMRQGCTLWTGILSDAGLLCDGKRCKRWGLWVCNHLPILREPAADATAAPANGVGLGSGKLMTCRGLRAIYGMTVIFGPQNNRACTFRTGLILIF